MQQGDYGSVPYYPYPPHTQNPNPNPSPDLPQSSYASAPPFSAGYGPSDFSGYSPSYLPYPQNPDPVPAPPTAPSYSPTPNPNLQSFNSASQAPSFPPFESHTPYQPPPPPPPQQQSYFPPYDQHQTAPNYAPPPASVPPNPNPSASPAPNSQFPSLYSAPYGQSGASVPPIYDSPYENYAKFDQTGGYFEDKYGSYGQSRSDLGSDLYGKRNDSGRDDGYGDGVYAYQGNKAEPYGARGTVPKSSSSTLFDDYGRSISFPSVKDSSVSSSKIVRAVPKADTLQDVKSGVQKFRVKLLAESGGQSTMDVLCQIGLDGIRMLDPSTSRTLRIYPLENITRCEKMDSSTLAVWSKSSVDIEPRRIRLQSNSYTANTLLDTVTAATVQ
ncbi:protein FREE1, partial [Morus notabilis]